MNGIEIEKNTLILASPDTCIEMVNTCYRNRHSLALYQTYAEAVASDTVEVCYERTSEDNGLTWSVPSPVFQPARAESGTWRWGENSLFFDEKKSAIVHFYNYHLYPNDTFSGEMLKYTRIFVRISFDEGKSFTIPAQIIVKGYDKINWAPDVAFGRNSMQISFCNPIKTGSGSILLPVAFTPQDADFSNPFSIGHAVRCLIGHWNGNHIDWEVSESVSLDRSVSARGLCEPTVAELSDGSLFMVCRGSNSGISNVPGHKWRVLSFDDGHTWSLPEPLCYDTGEKFFSPAAGSWFIRSTSNKVLYWIGNITSHNPKGGRPRYPLQIVEVDEEKKAVKKDSILVIEDRKPGDSEFVQFSNFRVYEERQTHDFILIMPRIQERGERDLSSPAYIYRLSIK